MATATLDPTDATALAAVQAVLSRRKLAAFIRAGWHVLEPAKPLVRNWHLDFIADHIQAALEDWIAHQRDPSRPQRIRDAVFNIPPGTAKSRLTSVFAPAWMWLHWPSWKVICLSGNPRVAVRDSLLCRELITSEWYRGTFAPPWELAGDQNAKTSFRNTAGGSRIALGITAQIIGERADAIVLDDPNDPEKFLRGESDIDEVNRRWDSTIASRVNDPASSLRIGIMQRLDEADWTGHVLAQGGWEHVCLPQEFEPERARTTAIGLRDPRTVPGELLFPARFPPEVLEQERRRLGSYGYAGQHQQRPIPAAGGLFRKEWFAHFADAVPYGTRFVRGWDKAGTQGGGDWSCGVKVGRGPDGKFYVAHAERGQWSAGGRNKIIRQTAELDGKAVPIWIEQEPGSGGKESAEISVAELAGWDVHTERPSGPKEARARPFAAQCEAGNVVLIRGDWNRAWIEEFAHFPRGLHDDAVDATSLAFNKLVLAPRPAVVARSPLAGYRG